MTVGNFDIVKICHDPCVPSKIYSLQIGLCIDVCSEPYKINTTGLYDVCYLAVVPSIGTISSVANTLGGGTTAILVIITGFAPANPAAAILGSLAQIIEYSRYLNITTSNVGHSIIITQESLS